MFAVAKCDRFIDRIWLFESITVLLKLLWVCLQEFFVGGAKFGGRAQALRPYQEWLMMAIC
jgi:hypothetical protein